MIPLAIHGIGPVGAFGTGLDEFRAALKGEKKVEPDLTPIKTDRGVYNLPVFRASTETLKTIIKSRELRRLDHFSKLALLGATLACRDARQTLISERTGLIVASGYGASTTTFAFLDSVINDGDALASPTLFSNSVHNAAAAHIAKHLKITGPNLSLTQGNFSLPMALLTAAQWLAEDRVDTVLCGVVEEYCEVLGYCWQSYRNQEESRSPNKNYATELCGPGEGSLFFWLGRAEGERAPHGYLEKLEFNTALLNKHRNTGSATLISSNPGHNNPEAWSDHTSPLWEFDSSKLIGSLPIATAFDLAATTIMLGEQTLYINNSKGNLQPLTFSGNSIRYWQPDPATSRNRLTGECYWITNCVNL